MSKKAKMQDKVAKLLRQAEDVVGTPEEAVFQAKAFEIISKYGIDLAQVQAQKEGLDVSELPDAVRWEVTLKGKYVSQQALLLHGLVVALHSKAVLSKRGSTQTMIIFSVPRHRERIEFLWSVLQPQMLRLVETVRPATEFTPRTGYRYNYQYNDAGRLTADVERYQKKTSGQLRSYRRSWIAGFAQAVQERVTSEENKALESSESGALVLFRGDKERAAVALRQAFPRTSRARSSRVNPSGYAHGQRDGRSATMQNSLAG